MYEDQLVNDAAFAGVGVMMAIIYLAVVALCIISMWILFSKANKPGWAAIIPVYNFIVFLQIAGKPWWWIFLYCIPIVNIVIIFIAMINFAKAFGKSAGYGVGMVFIFPILAPILAFSKGTKYVGATPA